MDGVDFNTYAEALRRALGESKSDVKIVKLGSYYSLEHTVIPREHETCPEIRSATDVFRRIIRAHKSKYESHVEIEGVMYTLSNADCA